VNEAAGSCLREVGNLRIVSIEPVDSFALG